ncbi:MAG: hypothetical protein ACR2P0_20190 [Acidimicrobiales bacterium]
MERLVTLPSDVTLRMAAAALALSVAVLPAYTVGRQAYGARAFAARVGELESLTIVNATWAWPARALLGAALLAAIGSVSQKRVLRAFTTLAFVVATGASFLSWRLVATSELIAPATGLFVAIIASAVGLLSAARPHPMRSHTLGRGLTPFLKKGSEPATPKGV